MEGRPSGVRRSGRNRCRSVTSGHRTNVIPVRGRRRSRGNVPAQLVGRGRVKHGYGPIQVEPFAKPVGGCGVRVDPEAGCLQVCVGRCQCRSGPGGSRWDGGNWATVGPEEASLTVIPQLDFESLFVHGSVVMSADKDKVVEPRCATVSPVPHVVRITVVGVAAWEAASASLSSECPPDGGRDGAGLAPDVEHGPVAGVGHDHSRGIAREAPRHLGGNADAVFQRCLPRRRIVSQAVCTHVDDDLIAVAGGAAIEVSGQGALGDESERVGPALDHRDLGLVVGVVIQPVGRGVQRALYSAPTSGDSRPRTTSIPSSSTQTSRCRLS